MTTLFDTLQDQDLGYLRAVAELWGLPEPARSGPQGASELIAAITEAHLIVEIYQGLSPPARQAYDVLLARSGGMPWTDFTREFGPIREVGPGRRDRERHWRSPQSAVEALWFRALIGREFRDTPTGPREFAFIPDEIFSHLAVQSPDDSRPLSQPPPQPDQIAGLSSRLVDDCVTILAALRLRPAGGLPLSDDRRRSLEAFLFQPKAVAMLLVLLQDIGALSRETGQTEPAPAGDFMTQERSGALHQLSLIWRDCTQWNDLALLEHVEDPSGVWPNDPVATRGSVLLKLSQVPRNAWWDITGFIHSVRERDPGFARPGGEFGSWYLRDRSSGRYLRGIEHWEAIEGALLHRLIAGPLHWLGSVDLGSYASGAHGLAFRLTDRFDCLLDSREPGPLQESTQRGTVHSSGLIRLPRLVSRDIRYGIARMSAWSQRDQDDFVYRLTPRSLDRATAQGLTARHLEKLLVEAGNGTVPPALLEAVHAHSEQGTRVTLEHGLVVKVQDAKLMDELIADRGISRMIVERLGGLTALVRENQVDRFLDACAHRGVLAQPPGAADSP